MSSNIPALIELGALDGINGFTINGLNADDRLGETVDHAGDVNGDGISDIILGTANAEAVVIFGDTDGFSANFDVAGLDGSNGFVIEAVEVVGVINIARASAAGDVNGDGIDDIIVGSPRGSTVNGFDSGLANVVFGRVGGFGASFDVTTIDGTNGVSLLGEATAGQAAGVVSNGGDINGDGFDDLIVLSQVFFLDPPNSSIVFGQETNLFPDIQLSALDGTNGAELVGGGDSLSSAGDVNGDGFDDFLIGNAGADSDGLINNGAAYLVYGQDGGFSASTDITSAGGAVFRGLGFLDFLGSATSGVGDVNGDGFDDFIIGVGSADPEGVGAAGQGYVIFGQSAELDGDFDLTSLDGSNGFSIDGVSQGDLAAGSVSSAGDFNGDGFDDIILGARRANPGFDDDTQPGQGEISQAYIVFGQDGGFSDAINLSSLDGSNGVVLNGVSVDGQINQVSSAGDINGDGFDDVIVSAAFADPNGNLSAGSSYVVFGIAPDTAVTRIGSAANQTIAGGAFADTLDGLGGDDILIGGAGSDILRGGDGFDTASYINATSGVTARLDGDVQAGDAFGDTFDNIEGLQGSRFDDVLVGDGANNIFFGDSGADQIFGGTGNDIVSYEESTSLVIVDLRDSAAFGGDAQGDLLFSIEGVTGSSQGDILTGNFSNNIIRGGNGADNIVDFGGSDLIFGGNGVDVIQTLFGENTILGGAGGDLIFGVIDNDTISGGDGDDVVFGNAFGDLIFGDDGSDVLNGQSGGDIIFGGAGGDFLIGEAGTDELNGDEGNDTIFGGNDGDLINGGEGDDALVGEGGNDTIDGGMGLDFLSGEEGVDTLNGGDDSDLISGGTEDDTLNGDGGGDVLFGDQGADTLNGGAGIDILFGDDNLLTVAGAGGDILNGGDDGDLLFGGSGNDTLNGDAGDDVIFGGEDDDIITGGAGTDFLLGDAGADTFIFEVGQDFDGVLDFEDGIDTLDLTAFGFADETAALAAAVDDSAGVFFNFGNGDSATIFGVTEADLMGDILV